MTRLLIKQAFLLALVCFILGLLHPIAHGQETDQTAIRVSHCSVSLMDQVTLAAGRSGVLGEVLVREGEQVEADQLVAQLVNDEAVANEALAEYAAESDIAIRLARKTRDAAETEFEQGKSLNENQSVLTAYEIRRLELAFEQSSLEVEQAVHEQRLKELELEVSRAQRKAHDIRSTIAGTVVHVFKEPGEAVQQGEPVVEIVNPKRLKVEAFVPRRLAGELDVGQKVKVRVQTTASDGNPTISGNLKFIDISVQPVTQEIRVWAEVDNSNGDLKPGQLAEMEIIID